MRVRLSPIIMAIAGTLLLHKPVSAQYVITEAHKAYNLYNFSKAKSLYGKAFDKKETPAAARGAADSYRLTKDYINAEFWYQKLWKVKGYTPADELHYAGILMNNSQYSAAAEHLRNYIAAVPTDQRAKNMLLGCDSAQHWIDHPREGDMENMAALNSKYSDWSLAMYKGKFIFASDRPYDSVRKTGFFEQTTIKKRLYTWTGDAYLHLYESDGKDPKTTKLLERRYVNGDYHSASASYTDSLNKMYLSITRFIRKPSSVVGKDSVYTMNIGVKEIDGTGGKEKVKILPFNKMLAFSAGDPWINPTGDTLYFISAQGPDAKGGTDIYYSVKGTGSWGTPVNLGPSINTEGNERTPYFDEKGKFYFASDGHPGLGGLDIYAAVKDKKGDWKIQNLGTPVNTAHDDFAPARFDNVLYLSSNRKGGAGSDDIYRFLAVEPPPPPVIVFDLVGTVFDNKTRKPLVNATIKLKNMTTGIIIDTLTNEKGEYHIPLDSVTDYAVKVSLKGYTNIPAVNISTNGLKETTTIKQDLELEKTVIGKPIKIENIYFDLGKADIRPDAAKELDKLIAILEENPTWVIELGSHTDSRAADAFNMALSQRRANATVAYLIKQGIPAKRLRAKGYGETKLVNKCANGVKCSEADHQANRRTEFMIISN
ncbi:WD40 repeat protein [Chitinophaga skermanii]|uniref:WD40 repeat protein n=1 Tax=Chitinophaga skermanii TaxID=331697 RepID=A0A327QXI6_9BACT|nr:OmpA family protein [Chitinophaga skermanii]RAJ08675.1 WD40 repeat protein [Chitinophaga skermanii]